MSSSYFSRSGASLSALVCLKNCAYSSGSRSIVTMWSAMMSQSACVGGEPGTLGSPCRACNNKKEHGIRLIAHMEIKGETHLFNRQISSTSTKVPFLKTFRAARESP